MWSDVWDWASALQPHSHTHALTVTCICYYDEIKGTQDLKIYSHAHSQILSLMPLMLRLKESSTSKRETEETGSKRAGERVHSLLFTEAKAAQAAQVRAEVKEKAEAAKAKEEAAAAKQAAAAKAKEDLDRIDEWVSNVRNRVLADAGEHSP